MGIPGPHAPGPGLGSLEAPRRNTRRTTRHNVHHDTRRNNGAVLFGRNAHAGCRLQERAQQRRLLLDGQRKLAIHRPGAVLRIQPDQAGWAMAAVNPARVLHDGVDANALDRNALAKGRHLCVLANAAIDLCDP